MVLLLCFQPEFPDRSRECAHTAYGKALDGLQGFARTNTRRPVPGCGVRRAVQGWTGAKVTRRLAAGLGTVLILHESPDGVGGGS